MSCQSDYKVYFDVSIKFIITVSLRVYKFEEELVGNKLKIPSLVENGLQKEDKSESNLNICLFSADRPVTKILFAPLLSTVQIT